MNDLLYKKLEDICLDEKRAIISGPFGSNISSKYFVDKGIPVIRGNNLSLSLDKFYDEGFVYVTKKKADELNCYAKKLDIIFTAAGTIGQVGLITNDTKYDCYVISNKQIRARLDPNKIDILYAYYWFTSPWIQKYLTSNNKGSTVPLLSLWEVKNLPIIYPKSMSKQKKISNIIDKISKKIELNNKINDELEVMAKTVYDYWFLQFEFPNEEGKPYKSSGGKMVWNDELKREIPEGWINGHLKEYIKNQKAGDWGKENAIDNYQKEVTCIRGADFSSITSFEKMDMPRRFILEKNSFKLLSVYDLLIEISGGSPIQSTGRICYINDAVLKRFSTKLITSNFCKAISLTDNNYFYWFYMLWKTLYINNVFFNYESKTTGIKNLLFDIMCEKYPICKPPIQIIRLYNQQVTPYFNKIQQNIIENQELTSLRDFLLPLLMNGQVGFKENKAEG